jgi:membrane protease YdiL (CAAX protease family)
MPVTNTTVRQESKPRDIWLFLAIAFATSWVFWLVGIQLRAREDLLIFGAAGPSFAAACMLTLRRRVTRKPLRFPWAWFAPSAPVSWAILVLAAASGARFRNLDWTPILVLPALVPGLAIGFFRSAGEIRWSGWRWPIMGACSWPVFLLTSAAVGHYAGQPIVQPRHDGSPRIAAGAVAILFVKQLLFAALLEEPGWRGWLLPRLQHRYSVLVASLLVWLPWALWHAPLDFTGGVGRTWLNYLEIRVVFFIPITILLTWLYNRSRGSILTVALFHAGFNTFPFMLPYWPPFLALLFVFAAWAVVGERMWRRGVFRRNTVELPYDTGSGVGN